MRRQRQRQGVLFCAVPAGDHGQHHVPGADGGGGRAAGGDQGLRHGEARDKEAARYRRVQGLADVPQLLRERLRLV